MDLTRSLKSVLPADVERRLNEPPSKAVGAAGRRRLHVPLRLCVYHRADANRTAAMREAMTVAYMSTDAVYDWPDWNSRVENTHGFGTAGLCRGAPLNKPSTPQLA